MPGESRGSLEVAGWRGTRLGSEKAVELSSLMLVVFLLVNPRIPRTAFPQSPVHAHGLSEVRREPSMFPQSPVFVQRAKSDLFPVQRASGPAEPRIVSVLVCLVSEFFVSEVSFFYVQHKASRSIEHPKDQGRIDTLRNLCCQRCCYCGATNPARSPCRQTPGGLRMAAPTSVLGTGNARLGRPVSRVR